jgi:transcriptional regulator with PAS, ATPase and Fis domain
VIDVPGIDDRLDDFDLLFEAIEDATISRLRKTIENMLKADPNLDRGYWRPKMTAITKLDATQRTALSRVPWSKHGNLRGLTSAVESLVGTDADVGEVISRLPRLNVAGAHQGMASDPLLDRLLARAATGEGLAAHLRAIELEDRRLIQTTLHEDSESLQRIADALGIDAPKLRIQLRTIARARRAGDRNS